MWSQAYASHMHALITSFTSQDLDLRGHEGPDNLLWFPKDPIRHLSITLSDWRHPLSFDELPRVNTMIKDGDRVQVIRRQTQMLLVRYARGPSATNSDK